MKAALKKAWVKALRSGKYKKGANVLRAKGESGEFEYCCLGVLAEISGCKWKRNGGGLARNGGFFYLNVPLATRLGIGPAGTDMDATRSVQRTLADKNDKAKSFKSIATWIEKHL